MSAHYDDEILVHFGVKGMRKGVRRAKGDLVAAPKIVRGKQLPQPTKPVTGVAAAMASARRAGNKRMEAQNAVLEAPKKIVRGELKSSNRRVGKVTPRA
nr:MAG TPA: hypothetical protein [Caudoviricetes sp.]